MAVDEPSEVSFFDTWSDVAVATNFLPIFVCESDLQCVDWTSSHYVRDTSYPVWELWAGPKKTPALAMIVWQRAHPCPPVAIPLESWHIISVEIAV